MELTHGPAGELPEGTTPPLPNVPIAADATGRLSVIQQDPPASEPPAAGSPAPAGPPPDADAAPRLVPETDLRRLQSVKDREVAEAKAQVQALQQQLAELHQRQRQAERQAKLSQASSPLERERLEVQMDREDVERQRQIAEVQAQVSEDVQLLEGWTRQYQEWGVPPEFVEYVTGQGMQQVNTEVARGQVSVADRGRRLHEIRHNAITAAMQQVASAAINQPRQQQGPQVPQQAPQQGQRGLPVQRVVQPSGATPASLSLDELERRAMSTGKDEDWAELYRVAGIR